MRNHKSRLSTGKHLIIILLALCASGCSSGGSCSSCNPAKSTPTPAPSPTPTPEPTPPPMPVPGNLVISAYTESEILEGDSTFAIVSLESSSGIVNPITVSITNNSELIVTTNPATCNLTTAANNCTVTLHGLESGVANFSALSSGYASQISDSLVVVPVFAYFANSGGNYYTQCLYSNINATIESATCIDHIMAGSGITPVSIVLDNSRNLAYILNSGSFNFTQCSVKANGIESTSCINITPSGGGTITSPSAMAFDTVNNYLYVLDQAGGSGPGITQCKVGASGIESPSCITTVSSIMYNPSGITLDNINHLVYIVNPDDPGYFTQCPVNESGVQLSACKNISPANGILSATAAGIGVDESRGYIYAAADTYFSPSISQCQINANGIESATCTNFTLAGLLGPGTINVFRGIAYIVDSTTPPASYFPCTTGIDGIISASCTKTTPTSGVLDVPRTVTFGK